MRKESKISHTLLWCALCLALSALGIVLYSGNYMKLAALLAGILVLVLAARCDAATLRSPFVWPLAGYVLFAGLSGLWAITGRYHLESYLQLFTAFCVFLFLLLRRRSAADAARGVLSLIAVTAGIYGFLSVEAGTTGLMAKLLKKILGDNMPIGLYGTGSRLYGIFGNPNVEATVFAYGIFFSVALLCDAKSRGRRALFAVTLAFCAFPMLLGFSMGAIACFAVAILLFLAFAGTQRVAALTRMLEGALPALACALVSYRLPMGSEPSGRLPHLFLLLLCAALCVAAELTLAERVTAALDKRQKLVVGAPVAALALIAVFVVIGVCYHVPHTFGAGLSRTLYPSAGEHVLHVDADGPVTVHITCSSRNDILLSYRATPAVVYDGADTEIRFTVPEDSILCTFSFSGEEGVTLRSATLDGAKSVPLDYPLLPSYVVGRLQGLRYDSNAMSRRQMAADARKLWLMSPVAGNGLGSFEVGAQMVQYTYYDTKYVHDHYAQTLCEVGAVGFALWIAALLAPLAALWRKRRDTEHPMRWCYAALWAAVVQVVLQSYTDVLFSFVVTLWYAFAVFALILRGYVTDAAAQGAADAQAARLSKRERSAAQKKQRGRDRLIRAALMAPVVVFLLTVCGTWAALSVYKRAVESQSEYYSNIERAAKLDLYNTEIYQYTYLTTTMEEPSTERERALADDYAEKLTRSRLSYVPGWLMTYYLGSGQYAKGVEEANVAARYFAGSQEILSQVASQLRIAFDKADTPLVFSGGDTLLDGLMRYHAALEKHNAESLITIDLGEENEAFFARVAEAYAHKDEPTEIFRVFSAK